MDFKDSIKQISERIETLKANLPTEEATKTAFTKQQGQLLQQTSCLHQPSI